MIGYFYDIESLENVFTLANYRDNDNVIEMYYLIDDTNLITDNFEQLAADRIRANNKNFKGTVEFYDLKDYNSNARLAKTFGLSSARYINNPNAKSKFPNDLFFIIFI